MNSINALSPKQLRQAADIQEKIQELQGKLSNILGGEVSTPSPAKAPKKRRMSAAGKANIRAAVKARWAKYNAVKTKPVKKAKRGMSAKAKAKMARLMKERWAKAKKAGKAKL